VHPFQIECESNQINRFFGHGTACGGFSTGDGNKRAEAFICLVVIAFERA